MHRELINRFVSDFNAKSVQAFKILTFHILKKPEFVKINFPEKSLNGSLSPTFCLQLKQLQISAENQLAG